MIDDRIALNQGEEFEIIIKSYFDVGKQNMLILWLILWTIAGIGILSQFFFNQPDGFTIYLIVWLAFWAYFEYKVIFAFMWRKNGLERIIVKDDVVTINREISGRGIPELCNRKSIKNLKLKEIKETNFISAMNMAYWKPGGERIVFDCEGRSIHFGMELNDKEAKNILMHFSKSLKRP